MSGRTARAALGIRHLSARPGGGLVVAGLVAVLAAVATVVPIAVGLLGDAALRDRLDQLGPTERDVATTSPGLPQIGAGAFEGEPATTAQVWGLFDTRLEDLRDDAASPLDELLDPAHTIARSLENPIVGEERTLALTLAYAPGYEEHVTLVAGEFPAATGMTLGEFGDVIPRGAVQIVLSAETATDMGWEVGDTRELASSARRGDTTPFLLTGTFEAVDPDDPYWEHATSLLTPNVFDDGDAPRHVTGTAFAHPASLGTAYDLDGRQESIVWYPFDADAVTGDDAEAALAGLRRFTTESQAVGEPADGYGILALRFDADAADTIELALGQARATAAVLGVVAAGPVGVAAAVLVLGCRLILARRRGPVRLLSARGASGAQVRGLLAAEGVLVGLVPAAVGVIAVLAATGAAVVPALLIAPLVVGLAPVAILVALAGSAAERPARADLGRRGSRLRVAAEGIVAGLAAAALVLLIVRGRGQGVDALLIATPLLLAVTAGIVTLRIYPIPLRALLNRMRRGPDLTSFVGAARALREPSLGLAPVLALVVGVAVAVSSGVLLSTLQAGVRDSAEGQTGADIRITGGTFTQDQLDAVRAIDGVAAATGVSGAQNVQLDMDGRQRPTSVFVVDAADLEEVQGDGLGILPRGVSLEPSGGRMPIVVSQVVADIIDGDPVAVEGVDAEVAGVSTGQTPIGSRASWIAIDSSYAEDILDRDPVDRTVLVRLDAGATAAGIDAPLRAALGEGIRLQTPETVIDLIEEGPAAQGLRIALVVATGLAALLGALAIVLTLALAAAPRERVLALLRTLGAPRRTPAGLIAWEVGPPTLAALAAGLVFGALLPTVVLAAVDLRSFTGGSVQPGYRADPAALALLVGGFVGVAAVFIALAVLASRRVRAASVLRTMGEG